MTYKQIETSRELRLWTTKVILPVALALALIPEVREGVKNGVNTIVNRIKGPKQ